jgi:hypothetical protein
MVPRAPEMALRADLPVAAGFAMDVGDVLLAWAGLVVVELLLVSSIHGDLFAGHWEVVQARTLVAPLSLAMLVPAACLAAFGARLLTRAARDRVSRGIVAFGVAGLFGLLGYGVSFGRHMHAVTVRAPFVAALAVVGAAIGYVAPTLARKLPPKVVGLFGAAVAAISWLADLYVLPRLYPAFHVALFVVLLAGVAAVVVAFRAETFSREHRAASWVVVAASLACLAWAPIAAHRLEHADNLRLVLIERAPVLGRAVRVAALLAPPPSLGEAPAEGRSMRFERITSRLMATRVLRRRISMLSPTKGRFSSKRIAPPLTRPTRSRR